MDDRVDLTVPMPASLNKDIESQLEYGDSKAGWVRDAIRMRIRIEYASSLPDPTSLSEDCWERVEFVDDERRALDELQCP